MVERRGAAGHGFRLLKAGAVDLGDPQHAIKAGRGVMGGDHARLRAGAGRSKKSALAKVKARARRAGAPVPDFLRAN